MKINISGTNYELDINRAKQAGVLVDLSPKTILVSQDEAAVLIHIINAIGGTPGKDHPRGVACGFKNRLEDLFGNPKTELDLTFDSETPHLYFKH